MRTKIGDAVEDVSRKVFPDWFYVGRWAQLSRGYVFDDDGVFDGPHFHMNENNEWVAWQTNQ